MKSAIILSALAAVVVASPGAPPPYPAPTTTSPAAYPTTTKTPQPYPTKSTKTSPKPYPSTKTSPTTLVTKTSSGAAPSSTDGFTNACLNLGISLLDCSQLLNIAALNGNTIIVGGSAPASSATPVNNGGPFVNQCKNFGISIADCAQLLNLALLNGNTIDINLGDLTSLLGALGSGGLLGSLTVPLTGLIPLPTGLL